MMNVVILAKDKHTIFNRDLCLFINYFLLYIELLQEMYTARSRQSKTISQRQKNSGIYKRVLSIML